MSPLPGTFVNLSFTTGIRPNQTRESRGADPFLRPWLRLLGHVGGLSAVFVDSYPSMVLDSAESPPPVLLVEDDEGVREAMREALEEEGYATLSAADGEQALAILARGPKPRLILLDLMMPVMNGWEFLKVLRDSANLARIPVVILSVAGSPPPGVPSIKKPISVQTLLRLVDEYAD